MTRFRTALLLCGLVGALGCATAAIAASRLVFEDNLKPGKGPSRNKLMRFGVEPWMLGVARFRSRYR